MNKDLLYRFFEGQASVEEMKKIKEWTERSSENRSQLYRERKLFDAMHIVAASQRGGKPLDSGKAVHLSFFREFMKIAVIVAVTVCVTATFFSIGNKDRNVAMQTVTVPPGQRVNLLLPDGTDVWLNAGTTMRYPVSFMEGKREITLDGEAYFDVKRDEECPFVVHTHAMDVEVLGTKFNVEAYSKKDFFETSLMQGKVKVTLPADKTKSVLLAPNQKTTLTDGQLVVSKIDDYGSYRWKEGLYCFHDKTLGEIMQDLEKYFDLDIKIHRKETADVVLTGKFRISEGLDYILRVLQTDVSFTYRRDTDQNIIYIK
ncbi:FecR family protein [Phocaeicola sartorii]|uniref:FecR family protein n=1 Tax=Phocaeicola sartorii TaxID=671267 RepID=UPI00351346B3